MTCSQQLQATLDTLFRACRVPSQIAELCRQAGVQGFQKDAVACPLCKLVREHVDFAIAFVPDKQPGNARWWVLPEQVSFKASRICEDFADAFDRGLYPDLNALPLTRDKIEAHRS